MIGFYYRDAENPIFSACRGGGVMGWVRPGANVRGSLKLPK